MPITFEEVTAQVQPPAAEAPPPAAPAASAAPAGGDALAAQLAPALRLLAERQARLSAD